MTAHRPNMALFLDSLQLKNVFHIVKCLKKHQRYNILKHVKTVRNASFSVHEKSLIF